MANIGVIMLVHTALDRAEQVARFWHASGCSVVIHVDSAVDQTIRDNFEFALKDIDNIRFSTQHRCEWGTWGLVAATLGAVEMMLRDFPAVDRVLLASGACLPLRPVAHLSDYLDRHPDTDFIESVTTAEVNWTVGGLGLERFTLHFPFSWRKHRTLFDQYVKLQRAVNIRRSIPRGLSPHMGSQWWCLTRQTLEAILSDPQRETYEKYFKRVWIPDESYFQTLVRNHGRKIESRSLTLSKFDFQGKPYVFYDDHLPLLQRSDCFLARKIWPHANRLYDLFLSGEVITANTDPNPGRIDRVFAKAVERRKFGRKGLYMQSRFPVDARQAQLTASPYTIFEGFTEVLDNFEVWLQARTTMTVHGHLFAPERAEFHDRGDVTTGAISSHPKLRDYNPTAFLRNLIWNSRGAHQCFQFGPRDSQKVMSMVVKDPNATLYVITGAWVMPLFQSGLSSEEVRHKAASLQQIEQKHLEQLYAPMVRARVRIWSFSEFAKTAPEILQAIQSDLPASNSKATPDLPKLKPLDGFPQFLQEIKNAGMDPYLAGDFPVSQSRDEPSIAQPKFYKPRR